MHTFPIKKFLTQKKQVHEKLHKVYYCNRNTINVGRVFTRHHLFLKLKNYTMNIEKLTIFELTEATEDIRRMLAGCHYPKMIQYYNERIKALQAEIEKRKKNKS